ncbi:MAG TPA: hypothetical protein VMV46_21265 [Thermoanaerobaculia bacterium]|nr:hypothetical protein [Thermoanaerobaculia bacterium]
MGLARNVFAASLLVLGVVHAIFGEVLTRMLPVWPEGLPGRPLWAHAAGVLLAIVAAMLLARRQVRGTAVVLGALLLVPVLGMHLPRAIPTGDFGNAWLNFFKWLAMAAGPLVLAAHVTPELVGPYRNRVVTLGEAMAP